MTVYHCKRNCKPQDFDTESGRLQMFVKQHLIYRFEILKMIDKGSFANVVKVFDHKNQKKNCQKLLQW